MAHAKFGSYRVRLPGSLIGRRVLGGGLVFGGTVCAFLPVFGVWMLPLGLIVLSVDSHRVRKFRRRWDVKVIRWWRARRAAREDGV